MKRIAFIIILYLLRCNIAIAQGAYTYTGNYLYSPFTDHSSCATGLVPGGGGQPGCPYWLGTCFEGWEYSHGTPFWGSSGDVYMWGGNGQGEGIVHPFNINIGDEITIRIKVNSFNFGTIEVWGISDIAGYKSATIPIPTTCGELPAPYDNYYLGYPSTPQPESLGVYTANVFTPSGPPNGPLSNYLLVFKYTATKNNTHILIMPNGNGTQSISSDLYIDYVEVCKGGSTNYNSDPLPGGTISKDNITIGNSSILINAQYSQNTEINAKGTLVLPNFSAVTDNEHFFLIEPKYKTCCRADDPPPIINNNMAMVGEDDGSSNVLLPTDCDNSDFGGNNSGGQSEQKPGISTYASGSITKSEVYNVYPNPSNGSFSIELPEIANYQVQVVDGLGKVVYRSTVNGVRKKTIDLASLESGNYSIQISNATTFFTQKLTIVH